MTLTYERCELLAISFSASWFYWILLLEQTSAGEHCLCESLYGRFCRSLSDIGALLAKRGGGSLDLCVRSKLLDDDSADPASLGIPPDVVTNLECFRHRESHSGSAC